MTCPKCSSILFSKPLNSMPERIILKSITKKTLPDDDFQIPYFRYQMLETKTGKYLGEMMGTPETICKNTDFYPDKTPYKSYYIEFLQTNTERSGHGKAFIELAQSESKKYGCGGKIHLIATRLYAPKNPPHLFYKKCGFISNNKKINRYFDACLKLKKKIKTKSSGNLYMYMPVEKIPARTMSKLTALFVYLKNLI